MTDAEKDMVKFQISQICVPKRNHLATTFVPHHKHLTEHSGTLDVDGDPCSRVKVEGRSRSKLTVNAADIAAQRKRAMEVETQMQETGEGAPRKRKKFGGLVPTKESDATVAALTHEVERAYDELCKKRDAASGRARGALTTKVNKFQEKHNIRV
ncbi:hypothetical protein EJ02DRAFT_461055 [Clathrospora elynae]|uniref:Uncharacterized protein n=1 Tax=Clathrospora elynae TaxID=706981 RepID=A0A6A5S1T8_9PLEO|nr:hypothetical protein EJ02DRAFT_461055 [Clathrospora elynae]